MKKEYDDVIQPVDVSGEQFRRRRFRCGAVDCYVGSVLCALACRNDEKETERGGDFCGELVFGMDGYRLDSGDGVGAYKRCPGGAS